MTAVDASALLHAPPSASGRGRFLRGEDARAALERDVRAGLTGRPKFLPSRWCYDTRGSALFDDITRLPEYYPSRAETAVIAVWAREIAAATRADTLVERAGGASETTRLLLNALRDAGTLRRFVPFEVDETALSAAGMAVAGEYAGVAVDAVAGGFERHLGLLPSGGRRLVAFLGSTFGNLMSDERASLLGHVAAGLGPDDALLLGTDLVKDEDRLVRAYDDAAGTTASFNRNVLHVLRRELGADVDPDAFDHVAVWDARQERIEMRLRSACDQVVRVLDLRVHFERGEELRTGISAKFRRNGVQAELEQAGLRMDRWWTDPDGDYAVSLSMPGTAQP